MWYTYDSVANNTIITKLFNSRQDWPFKWYSSIEDWFCRKTSQVWWGTVSQLRWEASWADTSSYSPPSSLYIWTYDTAQSFAAERNFCQRVRNIPGGLEYTLGSRGLWTLHRKVLVFLCLIFYLVWSLHLI